MAEHFAGLFMDEMKSGAGVTGNGLVFILVAWHLVRQPMLHVHACLRTFEKDGSAHHDNIATGRPQKKTTDVYLVAIKLGRP